MKISFILGSLNDSHYRKRVEEFVRYGYEVQVFGFLRKGQCLPEYPCTVNVLGTIKERNYKDRLGLFYKQIKSIAPQCKDTICFYSSLDIALFARLSIHTPYIYEVCDLTELVISNKIIRRLLVSLNKKCINKSLITIVTSQGFIDYFKNVKKDRLILIPNKVSSNCPVYLTEKKQIIDPPIKIGFAGVIRFESTYHFVKACQNRKDVEIHLFGIYSEGDLWSMQIKEIVEASSNMHFYGRFNNPEDLPAIYSKIDIVLCAYTPSPGVNYAEPNKLYEAIYFRKPIIVSEGTFLAKKVEELNIGYAIDSMNEASVVDFINDFTISTYLEKLDNCFNIAQNDCIDNYPHLFERLDKLIKLC